MRKERLLHSFVLLYYIKLVRLKERVRKLVFVVISRRGEDKVMKKIMKTVFQGPSPRETDRVVNLIQSRVNCRIRISTSQLRRKEVLRQPLLRLTKTLNRKVTIVVIRRVSEVEDT